MTVFRKFIVFAAASAGILSVGCGGSGSSTKANVIAQSAENVAPITVNAGPAGNYANGAFASVTLCVPGTSTCQTVDGVLVDTGSSGLRILSSVITVALPQQNATDGNPVVECLPFVGSYTWGPVQTADIQIAGEKASAVPLQVLSDTDFKVPSGCTNFGVTPADTLEALGANGILGVGLFAQDCGQACVQTGASNPGLYYECLSSTTCTVTGESLAQQLPNPVSMFASDNNGVIIELPAVSGGAVSVTGSLVFGIGTQTNNAIGSASVYTPDDNGYFTAVYKNESYPGSFIDSGSNGYFFLDSSITGLTNCVNAAGFYCPSSTENLSATNQGVNGTSGAVNFSVANAETLFESSTDFAFADLGGPAPDYFDWGLPFFFGRNVFTAIEGKSTTDGTGPFWAY